MLGAMNWLNPQFWLACIGSLTIAFALGGFTTWRYMSNSGAKAELTQVKADVKQGNDAAMELEAKKDERQIVYKTITKTVDRIVDRPVYRNECIDDDGLLAVNAALKGRTPAKPDAAVQRP